MPPSSLEARVDRLEEEVQALQHVAVTAIPAGLGLGISQVRDEVRELREHQEAFRGEVNERFDRIEQALQQILNR